MRATSGQAGLAHACTRAEDNIPFTGQVNKRSKKDMAHHYIASQQFHRTRLLERIIRGEGLCDQTVIEINQ